MNDASVPHGTVLLPRVALLLALAGSAGCRTASKSADGKPIASAGADLSSSATPSSASPGDGVPVLVELFTSEGCSSCPPADAVVAEIASAQPVAGARVVVLAHHVDYWNDLGWPDPYASRAATARQRAYAPLGGGSYTPQAVVDGRAELVGSKRGALEDAIVAAMTRTHAKVDLDVTPASGESFDVTVRIAPLPEGSAEADVMFALVQDRGKVLVPRGENGGRTLAHTAIARDVKALGLATKSGASLRTSVKIPSAIAAPEGSTFSAIAFVQERQSRHVLGAGAAAIRP